MTPTPRASAASAVRPDSAHGLITFDNVRTEDDSRALQQPPQFSRAPGAVPFTDGIGVSPDGKRVAIVRSAQTGTQLIIFATLKPNDVTSVLDLSGSGETAGGLVWAGDGTASVLLAVHKLSSAAPQMPTTYTTLRVVDVGTRQVREIARITTGSYFMPIAWRPDRKVAAALEVAAGAANSYDLIREGAAPERTPLGVMYGAITASRDGLRIAAVLAPAVRWWPMEQPSAGKTIESDQRGRAEFAAFRPGTDELGVSVSAPSTAPGAPPPGHFEIWNATTGRQRVVSPTIGFQFWRVDGTAAISGATLIDPESGATAPLPGGEFKIADVVAF